MRKLSMLLVSVATVLAFVVLPTTAGAAPADPEGLWATSVVPPCIAVSGDTCGIADYSSYELGVRFETSKPIYVVGVRFYRADDAMWSGSLWIDGGSRLASADDSTLGSGWQTALFSSPVAMGPGDTFVASYFAPAGAYAWEHNYFTPGGRTVGPVTALGGIGVNGLYTQSSTSTLPTSVFMDSNYWVTPLWIPQYTLSGFYAPVDMGGVFNTVKGGSTVPMKFEVFDSASGAEQTDVAVVDGFVLNSIACPTSDFVTDAIEEFSTVGSGLRYDFTAGQFIQNWKTPKKAGMCYEVTMFTTDGSSITANFKLK